MNQLVADSSSLILLAKCHLREVVCSFFEVRIPPAVKSEVASAKLTAHYPDAALISRMITKRKITVANPESDTTGIPVSLHRGEKEALRLSIQLGRCLLATDDGKAIKAARFLGVPFVITPKIVVELHRLKRVPLKKAREALEKLSKIGRYSPEIISAAFVALMENQNGQADDNQDT